MMRTISSRRHSLFLAASAFVLFLVFGYVSDLIVLRHSGWVIADGLIMATAAGLVVLFYERERGRLLSEKLRVIRDMNSFVRNELQILYASTEHLEKTRVSAIEHSVARIDWALRELLPGHHPSPAAVVKNIGESKDNAERSA